MDRKKVQSYLKNKNMHLITEADDSAIAKIVRTNLEKYHLDIPGTAYFDPELDHLSEYYDRNPEQRAYFILADETGEVIGGAGLAEFPGFEQCVEIQKLYVADEWEAGFKSLYLETHSNLKTAMHMYEKYGFQLIERPETVVHSTMDRFYMKEI